MATLGPFEAIYRVIGVILGLYGMGIMEKNIQSTFQGVGF